MSKLLFAVAMLAAFAASSSALDCSTANQVATINCGEFMGSFTSCPAACKQAIDDTPNFQQCAQQSLDDALDLLKQLGASSSDIDEATAEAVRALEVCGVRVSGGTVRAVSVFVVIATAAALMAMFA